jgi:hypothetical protein
VKVLRPPDTFEVDDPVRYSLWREQFLNWLVFCDSRNGELIKDVENLDVIEPMETSEPHVKELSASSTASCPPTFVAQPYRLRALAMKRVMVSRHLQHMRTDWSFGQ